MFWLDKIFSHLATSQGRGKPRAPRQWRFEPLEPRQLLATGGVTYQGGPLINNVAVETVFLGQAWTTDPSLEQNAAQLDQFFGSITNSTFMDLMAQYGTAQAGPIGHGSFAGQVNVPQDPWRQSTVSDATIQSELNAEIQSGAIAPPDSNRLLFVFTPPNIVVSQGGSRSNGYPTGFAGYHGSFVDSAGQLVPYAVVPNPIGNDQVGGLTAFEQQTAAASHELAEAVTDPDGTSWWDNRNDATSGYEVGDFADLGKNTVYLDGYAVEDIWSNASQGLAAPSGATLTPTTFTTTPPAASGSAASGLPGNLVPSNLGSVAESLVHDIDYETSLITRIYQHDLGRSPDGAGLNYWTTQLQSGTTDQQLEATLLASPEYVGRQGGTAVSWILGMYHDLLGRPADGAGLAYWTSQLQAGVSFYQLALEIASSGEREAMVVAADYQTFLGRAASPGEIAFWVHAFEHGAQNEDLIAGFVASPEYDNNPTKGQGNSVAWIDSVFHDLYQSTPTSSQLTYWLGQLA